MTTPANWTVIDSEGTPVTVDADTGEIAEDAAEPAEPKREYTGDEVNERWLRSRVAVPDPDEFDDQEYLEADDDVTNVMDTLIARHHMAAREFNVRVLWKKKGGKAKGKLVFGQTQKVSGLTYYAFGGEVDAVILLSANWIEAYEFTQYQLEALLFHELQHIDATYDENGIPSLILVDHDIEGFTRDVRLYGDWRPEYRSMKRAIEQMPLIPEGFV